MVRAHTHDTASLRTTSLQDRCGSPELRPLCPVEGGARSRRSRSSAWRCNLCIWCPRTPLGRTVSPCGGKTPQFRKVRWVRQGPVGELLGVQPTAGRADQDTWDGGVFQVPALLQ